MVPCPAVPTFDALARSTVNCLWASVAAAIWQRLGLSLAVVSPGSRNTPLTWALSRTPGLRCLPVLDERSAAFLALGAAKATGRPVLLVCTSGTAGANYFPALIEAREAGVPLLVVTADRPAEMRHCHSGQTIDQPGLFGRYPVFQADLALPEATDGALRYLRGTIAYAWHRALGPVAGPVHLNQSFRDPLAPVPDRTLELPPALATESWWRELAPTEAAPLATAQAPNGCRLPPMGTRGLIVVGAQAGLADPATLSPALQAAEALGWPILADALAAERHLDHPLLVAHYDILLRNAAVAGWQPDAVWQFGPLPTSKTLRAWLEQGQRPVSVFDARGENQDPLHRPARFFAAPPVLPAPSLSPSAEAYSAQWLAAEHQVRRALDIALREPAYAAFEGKVAWLLSQHLPRGTPVLVANSMPVRDAEFFWAAGQGQRVAASRGANGIDGTLSTALGLALGTDQPTVLLTGDLALLHDTNGWLNCRHLTTSLTVVCVNNSGGGIFENLPVAAFNPPFEEFFATPQAVDFGQLAAAYGIAHQRLTDLEALPELLANLPATGVRLIEVITDRKRDTPLRKALLARLAAGAA